MILGLRTSLVGTIDREFMSGGWWLSQIYS